MYVIFSRCVVNPWNNLGPPNDTDFSSLARFKAALKRIDLSTFFNCIVLIRMVVSAPLIWSLSVWPVIVCDYLYTNVFILTLNVSATTESILLILIHAFQCGITAANQR